MAKQLVPMTTEVENANNIFEVENMQLTRKKNKSLKVTKLTCDFCDIKFKLFKDLENHCSLLHHDREFNCSKCEFKTNFISRLKLHQKKSHDPKNCCESTDCGFQAMKKVDVSNHNDVAHVIEQEQRQSDDEVLGEENTAVVGMSKGNEMDIEVQQTGIGIRVRTVCDINQNNPMQLENERETNGNDIDENYIDSHLQRDVFNDVALEGEGVKVTDVIMTSVEANLKVPRQSEVKVESQFDLLWPIKEWNTMKATTSSTSRVVAGKVYRIERLVEGEMWRWKTNLYRKE